MIADGKTVRIHYTGTLNDGTQFDSSAGRDPLEFETGSGMVIPGFDSAVRDMEVGSKKTVTIPAAEAYGEAREEMIGEKGVKKRCQSYYFVIFSWRRIDRSGRTPPWEEHHESNTKARSIM
jgi:hypothetical protein